MDYGKKERGNGNANKKIDFFGFTGVLQSLLNKPARKNLFYRTHHTHHNNNPNEEFTHI
jgi:hypothetical protein